MIENIKKEIGARFKEVRAHYGLTQQELADSLNCSQPKIKDIEKGRIMLVAETAILFAKKYKISLDWLYLGTEDMFSLEGVKTLGESDKILIQKLIERFNSH